MKDTFYFSSRTILKFLEKGLIYILFRKYVILRPFLVLYLKILLTKLSISCPSLFFLHTFVILFITTYSKSISVGKLNVAEEYYLVKDRKLNEVSKQVVLLIIFQGYRLFRLWSLIVQKRLRICSKFWYATDFEN